MGKMHIRLYEKDIKQLPDDLYIPPAAFAIWLEQFEGPLDFLLYLVKKNNFDITTTAVLPITEQYLSYIHELNASQFELAGDYLLMASTLIAIKSQLLLPKPETEKDDEDPRVALVERLEAYAQIKEASLRIDKLIRLERDVYLSMTSLPDIQTPLINYDAELLTNALLKMQLKPGYQEHAVHQDKIPLADRLVAITRRLANCGTCRFYELLDKQQGKLGAVVSFIAVLELLKQQHIRIEMLAEDEFMLAWVA